ncbi:MFS transporter [Streptomyces lunaelactis]|uniref:MFS transporter n=1 Tax=Streptomyces lunaelactis TaxID=1535768 RepID=UPI0015848964|nr:MFS transporter [Streptomyces lunaelactis]NUK49168.1 MFS transporter [Streptomyces lunaelactis]
MRDSPRNRPLLRLALSLFALRLGATMTAVGLPLLVLQRYGSGLLAALTLALELLPNVLFGAVVGDLVDRGDPRRYAMGGALGGALVIPLVPAASELWQIQVLAFASGIAYAFGVPARMSLRAVAVPAGSELRGNAMLVSAQRLPNLIGPAVAGMLVPFGFSLLFLTDAAFALIAALLLIGLPAPAPVPPDDQVRAAPVEQGRAALLAVTLRRMFVDNVRELTRLVTKDRFLAVMTLTSFTYMFGFGVSKLFLPLYALHHYSDVPGMFGYLAAGIGLGASLGGFLAAAFGRFRQGAVYMTVNVVEGICWLLLPLLDHPAPAIAVLVLAGAFEAVGTVVFYAEVQSRLAARMTGRYFALLIPLCDAFLVLGVWVSGALTGFGELGLAALIAIVRAGPALMLAPGLLSGRAREPEREPVAALTAEER